MPTLHAPVRADGSPAIDPGCAVDALWPHLDVAAGAANLRGGQVVLFPSAQVETDVEGFERAALYTGDLLPDALYEEWTQSRRGQLPAAPRRAAAPCRRPGRLVEAEPTDE